MSDHRVKPKPEPMLIDGVPYLTTGRQREVGIKREGDRLVLSVYQSRPSPQPEHAHVYSYLDAQQASELIAALARELAQMSVEPIPGDLPERA